MNNFESLQTGSVRKKGSQWYYRFRIKDQDGNWKMHEFKGGQTKAETTFMLKQALEEYRQDGSIFYAGSLTVGQLADMWYNAEIENSNLTTNGKYGYKNVINNIHNNPFSQIKLKDLTIEDIQEYVDGLYFGVYDNEGNQIAKPYAKATMRKFFLVLNNMFKYAVYPKKLLRENLMQYVKKRKGRNYNEFIQEICSNNIGTDNGIQLGSLRWLQRYCNNRRWRRCCYNWQSLQNRYRYNICTF